MRRVDELLRSGEGVVRRRDHPRDAGAIDWALATGCLIAVLPGIYVRRGCERDIDLRCRAAALSCPDAVITGRAAARFTYWPNVAVKEVSVAVANTRPSRAGFEFARRAIPVELRWHRNGIQVTSPSLTALDLASWDDSEALDGALRVRAVTLDTLYAALSLTKGRRGNTERRRLLIDSRAEPWSAAERRIHRLLREARITGWKANLPFHCTDGRLFYLDIGFARQKLAIEIDGTVHFTDRGLFESDRWRQNQLVLHGWRVLRFTWDMLVNHPDEVLASIRAALALCRP